MLEALLREMRARVDGMVTRAVIELVNDKLKTQRLQLTLLADQHVDDVEHMQPYGVSFVPPAGSEALALAVAGARSHTVAICAQHPGERPTGGKPRTGGLYTKGQWRLFVDEQGVLCVGAMDSDEHMVLGDYLVDLYSKHTHQTAMGPSAPPDNAAAASKMLSRHKVAK